MANTQGVLKESIWTRDKDFRALPRTAQATYAQLISQRDLDNAGIQPLFVSKWAKACDEITEASLWLDLEILQERRFVFYDIDTDELFVRAYMRIREVARYPNILKNALRCASTVASEKLRRELAMELRRLRKADANTVADEIDSSEPTDNDSETDSHRSVTVERTVPEGLNGSERGSTRVIPRPSPIALVPEVVTTAAAAADAELDEINKLRAELTDAGLTASWSTMPLDDVRLLISIHGRRRLVGAALGSHWPNNPAKSAKAWLPIWRDLQPIAAASGISARQTLINDCPNCDPNGWRLDDAGKPTEPAIRCDHTPIEANHHA